MKGCDIFHFPAAKPFEIQPMGRETSFQTTSQFDRNCPQPSLLFRQFIGIGYALFSAFKQKVVFL